MVDSSGYISAASVPILQLLASKYQALLVRRDALVVQDLTLHILDEV